MRLICPNCVAQYEVDENVIPAEGRDVQCANCGHNWFQDALQMLSSEAEIPSRTGDPDSDVPPELFHDLEGKLDSEFVSARGQTAPDPNDMEPEEPRDDFQIEQEPSAPSTRLDQDALDIIHAEAEYSSGEKPPAAEPTETDDTLDDAPVEDAPVKDAQIPPEETIYAATDEPLVENEDPVETAPEADDLDEIRQRIKDLEAEEDYFEPDQQTSIDPISEPPQPDAIDDLVIPVVANQAAPDMQPHPPEQAAEDRNPFARPLTDDTSATDPVSAPIEQEYAENIPFEETISAAFEQNKSDEDTAPPPAAAQEMEAEVVAVDRPQNRVSPRPFPKIGETTDDLYNASQKRIETRRDLFPDVDELSSEIASDAHRSTYSHPDKADAKIKSGFLRGFKYAILLCILTGIIYLSQPVIVEYVPETAPYLSLLTDWVNQAVDFMNALVDRIV